MNAVIDTAIQDILWENIEELIRDELCWVEWGVVDDVMGMIYCQSLK